MCLPAVIAIGVEQQQKQQQRKHQHQQQQQRQFADCIKLETHVGFDLVVSARSTRSHRILQIVQIVYLISYPLVFITNLDTYNTCRLLF